MGKMIAIFLHMITKLTQNNWIVAATLAFFLTMSPAVADEAELDALFERLQQDVLPEHEEIESKIWKIWSSSGSDSIDLLLSRGRKALDDEDLVAAIEHFTAVIDHAPDFAEGYNMRATAYYLSGMIGPSLADVEITLALNPRHYGALSGLGTMLVEMGREKEALKAYRAAQALNPHRKDVIEAVATLQARVGERDI